MPSDNSIINQGRKIRSLGATLNVRPSLQTQPVKVLSNLKTKPHTNAENKENTSSEQNSHPGKNKQKLTVKDKKVEKFSPVIGALQQQFQKKQQESAQKKPTLIEENNSPIAYESSLVSSIVDENFALENKDNLKQVALEISHAHVIVPSLSLLQIARPLYEYKEIPSDAPIINLWAGLTKESLPENFSEQTLLAEFRKYLFALKDNKQNEKSWPLLTKMLEDVALHIRDASAEQIYIVLYLKRTQSPLLYDHCVQDFLIKKAFSFKNSFAPLSYELALHTSALQRAYDPEPSKIKTIQELDLICNGLDADEAQKNRRLQFSLDAQPILIKPKDVFFDEDEIRINQDLLQSEALKLNPSLTKKYFTNAENISTSSASAKESAAPAKETNPSAARLEGGSDERSSQSNLSASRETEGSEGFSAGTAAKESYSYSCSHLIKILEQTKSSSNKFSFFSAPKTISPLEEQARLTLIEKLNNLKNNITELMAIKNIYHYLQCMVKHYLYFNVVQHNTQTPCTALGKAKNEILDYLNDRQAKVLVGSEAKNHFTVDNNNQRYVCLKALYSYFKQMPPSTSKSEIQKAYQLGLDIRQARTEEDIQLAINKAVDLTDYKAFTKAFTKVIDSIQSELSPIIQCVSNHK